MKTLLLTLLALTCISAVAPVALAVRRQRTVTVKSIDISNDPEVLAAQKRHKEATKALQAARDKRDKAAVEAAEKTHIETERALSATRRAAFARAQKAAKNRR